MSWLNDVAALIRGIDRVNRALVCRQQKKLQCIWQNSSLRPVARAVCTRLEETVSCAITKCGPPVSLNSLTLVVAKTWTWNYSVVSLFLKLFISLT